MSTSTLVVGSTWKSLLVVWAGSKVLSQVPEEEEEEEEEEETLEPGGGDRGYRLGWMGMQGCWGC